MHLVVGHPVCLCKVENDCISSGRPGGYLKATITNAATYVKAPGSTKVNLPPLLSGGGVCSYPSSRLHREQLNGYCFSKLLSGRVMYLGVACVALTLKTLAFRTFCAAPVIEYGGESRQRNTRALSSGRSGRLHRGRSETRTNSPHRQ